MTAHADDLDVVFGKTRAAIERIVAGADGVVGMALIDLAGDGAADLAINADVAFAQASAIKVPILMEVHKQAAEGRFALTDRLEVTAEHQVGGSGVLSDFASGGSAISVHDLCVLMIVLSDNSATNMLIDLVGMERTTASMALLGATNTKLRRHMMDTAASARGDENVSTPADAARIMAALHRGEFVSREVCDQVLTVLRMKRGGNIRAGLEPDTPMASKTGSIPGVSTEWAIIELERRPFVLVVMEKYQPLDDAGAATRQIATEAFRWFALAERSNAYGALMDPKLWDTP